MKPIAAGASVTVTVTRDIAGNRVVTSPPGVDGNALLASFDRDFVLLDHKTLQSFMDHKALERGRSFAGLLGLAKYSKLRQELEALANTRALNRHFSTHNLDAKQTTLVASTRRKRTEAATAFNALTQTALAEQANHIAATTAAHKATTTVRTVRSRRRRAARAGERSRAGPAPRGSAGVVIYPSTSYATFAVLPRSCDPPCVSQR